MMRSNDDELLDEYLMQKGGRIRSTMEYNQIRDIINEKYDADLSIHNVQVELKSAFNKMFSAVAEEYPTRLFDVVQVFVEEFKIPETTIVRYLNKKNYEMLSNFASNIFQEESDYLQRRERARVNEKLEKKGKKVERRLSIHDLFDD